MQNLPVSIIITTYNDAEYLSDAIDSVFNQKLLPKQLVVVDDGSDSDESYKVISKYTDNDKNINVLYFRKENGGASSARNLGIQHVDQPYTTFLDADDKMLPDNLIVRYHAIKELGDEYFGVYGSGITSEGKNYDFINTNGIVSTSYVGKLQDGIPGGCYYYLFRTHCLKDIGGFDEELSNNEDFDILIRLLKAGKSCKGDLGYGNHITIRENSLSRDSNSKKVFNSVMRFLDKAEKYNYFSKQELNNRRKYAYLSLAKRIIYNKPFEAIGCIRKAFEYSGPVGFQEKLACGLSLSWKSKKS